MPSRCFDDIKLLIRPLPSFDVEVTLLHVFARKNYVNKADFLKCTSSPLLAQQLGAVQGACEVIGNLWSVTPSQVLPSVGS